MVANVLDNLAQLFQETGRLSEAEPLYLRALAGSVISCGKAAMEVWFSRCGTDLSPKSLAILRQLLIDSMGLLGSGFTPQAPTSAPHSPERS